MKLEIVHEPEESTRGLGVEVVGRLGDDHGAWKGRHGSAGGQPSLGSRHRQLEGWNPMGRVRGIAGNAVRGSGAGAECGSVEAQALGRPAGAGEEKEGNAD